MKKTAEAIGITLLVLVGVFYYWSEGITDPAGLHGSKRIEIRSSAGAVDVVGTDSDNITVTVDGQDASASGTQVRIDKGHFPTRVEISRIPQNTRVEVQVPADASIAATMTAGELRIRGVHGDIESLLRSGRTIISVDDAQKIRSADASVLAGEVTAPVFHRRKGGLFRRFVWAGNGANVLRAHVTTGQLVLQ